MSDEKRLLAVIAVIYLADCVFWIPRGGLAFTRWFGRDWTPRAASQTFGNQSGAFGLANPLPPLGLAARAVGWPISMSEEGIFSYVSTSIDPSGRPPQRVIFHEWKAIDQVERDGKKIFVNGHHFASGVSEYSARWLAENIARLSKANNRGREIDKLVFNTCDTREINRRVVDFEKQTRWLKYCSNWLFVFLFGACPFLVWKLGFVAALWPVVIGIYAQTVLIALLFSRLHRRLYPSDKSQIFKPFLTMLLAAPSAIRAQDILGRPLLEEFHPVACLKSLSSAENFSQMAGMAIRDLHYPRFPIVPTGSSELAAKTEDHFRLLALKSLNRSVVNDETEFLKPPKKSEAAHASFCQRCLQQFTESATNCPDCGGRSLTKF